MTRSRLLLMLLTTTVAGAYYLWGSGLTLPSWAQGSAHASDGSAAAALAVLPVARTWHDGYTREAFGPAWDDVDGNGCDTRNDILSRDLTDVRTKAGSCVVLRGRLHDPYTGKDIPFTRGPETSKAVQIDHVVPLADAWGSGAWSWSAETRRQFANDPENLLATSGAANQAKSDSTADRWLPPQKNYRCAFVARVIAVKSTWNLAVSADEKAALQRQMNDCPGLDLPE